MTKVSNYIVTLTLFILGLYLVSLFFPTQEEASHSELIYGDINNVYKQFDELENWTNWCVWTQVNKSDSIQIGNIKAGDHASLVWVHRGKNSSNGKIEIVESLKNKSIKLHISTNDIDTILTKITFDLKENGVLVTWKSDFQLRGSGSRIMGYFLKRFLIRDIKKSLRKINWYLMKTNQHTGWISDSYVIEASTKPIVYNIIDTIRNEDFDSLMVCEFDKIKNTLKSKYQLDVNFFYYRQLQVLDSSRAIYIFGTPVENDLKGEPQVQDLSGEYILMRYYGSQAGFKSAYQRAEKIADAKGLILSGTTPFVTYSKYPIDFEKIDTFVMGLSFPILKAHR